MSHFDSMMLAVCILNILIGKRNKYAVGTYLFLFFFCHFVIEIHLIAFSRS